jgi:phage tail tape-measure protein
MEILCLQYNIEHSKDRVGLMFGYASEDISNNKFNWDIFLKSFKEAGKFCKFFPTYADIMEKVKEISYKGSINTFEALPAHRDKELASKYLKMIRERKYEEELNDN